MHPNYELILVKCLKNALSNQTGKIVSNTDLEKCIGRKDLINRILRKNISFSKLSIDRIDNAITRRLHGNNLNKAINAICDYKNIKGLENKENNEFNLINSLRKTFSNEIGDLVSLSKLSQIVASKDTLPKALRGNYALKEFTIDKIEYECNRNLTGTNMEISIEALNKYRKVRGLYVKKRNVNQAEIDLIKNLRTVFSYEFGRPVSRANLSKLVASESLIKQTFKRRDAFRRYSTYKMRNAIAKFLTGDNYKTALDAISEYCITKGYIPGKNAQNKAEFNLISNLQRIFSREFGKYIYLSTLSQYFGSDTMISRTLRNEFRFKNSTIGIMEEITKKTLSGENQDKALHALDTYRYNRRNKIAHQEDPYPEPNISTDYIIKLKKFPKLKSYIKNLKNLGLPDYVFKHYDIQPRISEFKIKGIDMNYRKVVVSSLKNLGLFKELYYDSNYKNKCFKNIEITAHELMNYAQIAIYKENELSKRSRLPKHDCLSKKLYKNYNKIVGSEIPIFKYIGHNFFLTGHPDILLIHENSVIIADYKPSNQTSIGTLKRKFFHSLPQICSYGILFQQNFGLKDVKCISFNHVKAWIYEPNNLLKRVNIMLRKFNNNIKMPWNLYINI